MNVICFGQAAVTDSRKLQLPYLGLKVGHGLVKGLWWRPLVVTENSDGSVGPVVGQYFLCHIVRLFGWRKNNSQPRTHIFTTITFWHPSLSLPTLFMCIHTLLQIHIFYSSVWFKWLKSFSSFLIYSGAHITCQAPSGTLSWMENL